MSMPDEHAANPVFKEIARNPINILIDRIVWSAMDEQVTVRKPRKARQRQPFQICLADPRPMIVDDFRNDPRALAVFSGNKITVMVSEQARNLPSTQQRQTFIRLGVVTNDVTEAEDIADATAINIVQHRLESGQVRVNIGNECEHDLTVNYVIGRVALRAPAPNRPNLRSTAKQIVIDTHGSLIEAERDTQRTA